MPAARATCHDSVSPTPTASAPAAIGPDHRDDLDEAREGAHEDEVREADRPERKREDGPNEHDQQRRPAHERAQLEVDQVPGVAQASFVSGALSSDATRSTARSRSKIQ